MKQKWGPIKKIREQFLTSDIKNMMNQKGFASASADGIAWPPRG